MTGLAGLWRGVEDWVWGTGHVASLPSFPSALYPQALPAPGLSPVWGRKGLFRSRPFPSGPEGTEQRGWGLPDQGEARGLGFSPELPGRSPSLGPFHRGKTRKAVLLPFPATFLPPWGAEGIGLRQLRALLCPLARRFLLLLSPRAYFNLRRRWFNRSMRVTRPRNWSPSMTMGTRP